MTTIIFDLNGTLYDPATGGVMEDGFLVLEQLQERGYEMHLVSKKEPGRPDRLKDLGLAAYFATAAFVESKEERLRELIEAAGGDVYVVGDYLHNEIRHGNRFGARTVWLRRGHLSHLTPMDPHDEPWRTIAELRELIELIP